VRRHIYELDRLIWFVIGLFVGIPYGLAGWIFSPLVFLYRFVLIGDLFDVIVFGFLAVIVSAWIYPLLGAILWKIKKESIYLVLGMIATSSITAYLTSILTALIGAAAISPGL